MTMGHACGLIDDYEQQGADDGCSGSGRNGICQTYGYGRGGAGDEGLPGIPEK